MTSGEGGVVTPAELRTLKKEARKKMGDGDTPAVEEGEEVADSDEEEKEPEITRIRVPKHKLLHVGNMELTSFVEGSEGQKEPMTRQIPKELKLVVELPTVAR